MSHLVNSCISNYTILNIVIKEPRIYHLCTPTFFTLVIFVNFWDLRVLTEWKLSFRYFNIFTFSATNCHYKLLEAPIAAFVSVFLLNHEILFNILIL